MTFRTDEAYAVELDRADPLARFRERFLIPAHPGAGASSGPGDTPAGQEIYLCGNSLGLQPRSTRNYIDQELAAWAERAVKGHHTGARPWLPYHEFLTEHTARLVGALPGEVVNMNTLTVNLHLMMVSFYRPTRERYKLLIESPAFPSDRYAAESQVRFHGRDPADALLEIGPRPGEAVIRDQDLYELIEREGERIALVLLPGVQYYSGQAFDMRAITARAHARGCAVGFDLAHATGNLVLALHDWDVDFAAWCNYKYVNAGPGAVAGCFVHERHHRATLPRFAGWWGHDKATRFDMGPDFRPIPSAEAWQLSNPPIFSLAPVLASLEIFAEAGMDRLRAKSERLTGYLEFLLRERLSDSIDIITPAEPARRGCQMSLRMKSGDIEHGRKVFHALEAAGVTCDWREPDVIRVAPVPLYNTFLDVFRFTEILQTALQ